MQPVAPTDNLLPSCLPKLSSYENCISVGVVLQSGPSSFPLSVQLSRERRPWIEYEVLSAFASFASYHEHTTLIRAFPMRIVGSLVHCF